MTPDFSDAERRCAATLIDAALDEDLAGRDDLTTSAVIPGEARAEVNIVVRQPGVVAGLPIVPLLFARLDRAVEVELRSVDGEARRAGDVVAALRGGTRSLLIGERTALNFLTRLSGIATLTRAFVERIAGTQARILDTRKTLPGWRALEKYAVRCGGGVNHRFGLYDGVLIKDNHLAAWSAQRERPSLDDAVRRARAAAPRGVPIEVEVDTLDQLRAVLPAGPDMVLLDNMSPALLAAAVAIRNDVAPAVKLEASGGVTLDTVRAIAESGVDRISVGALTHSAPALDLALDWASALRE
ncbi:MAG: carboxylating nicotinate-nucleotide diphosphorylase [Planctomyces sp.]|nr:carboxylating nicotinate-nucleotide diphosphorylase [Planctomyces sp.]